MASLSALSIGAAALVVVGLGVVGAATRALARRHRESSLGALVAIDAGRPSVLRSSRYRLAGRPDAVRRTSDGRLVPVELKSRRAPPRGPSRSHLVELWAYCLLLEEASGHAPPFGVLRYADREFRVRWDDASRSQLLAVRAEVDRPYDGRATPSAARCARCSFADVCDARYDRA